jgi:Ricin-type beta-trefoil lectin domain
MRRSARVFAVLLFSFAGCLQAQAQELAVTPTSPMVTCPSDRVMIGIDPASRRILCSAPFSVSGRIENVLDHVPTASSGFWPPSRLDALQHGFTASAMHWCDPNRVMTGIDQSRNVFRCGGFFQGTLGRVFTTPGTPRQGIRACPRGAVMVGLHIDAGVLLCAEAPYCTDNAHCALGRTCEFPATTLGGQTGICRAQGLLLFREDNFCRGGPDGRTTDRSGVLVRFTSSNQHDNDSAESAVLQNVHAGALIRIFDRSDGRTDDDFAQVLVRATTPQNYCLPTFEPIGDRMADEFVEMTYHNVGNDLDDKVSRVEVDSAILSRGGLCLDVIDRPDLSANPVQLFPCHMGPNQRWVISRGGTIRGLRNFCLEADPTGMPGWTLGGTNSAAVRMAPCTGAAHQVWSMDTSQRLRMFSDMCLDIPDGNDRQGQSLRVFPCHFGASQRWLTTF